MPGRARDKGGLSSWGKARRDIERRLRDTAAHTTTVFDFYGLPDDFPTAGPRSGDPIRDVKAAEAAMAEDLGNARFIPFLALHEFEAWIFAEPSAAARHFGDAKLTAPLVAVANEFPTIEHINHGSATHPSERLRALISGYKKRSDGPTILEAIGVGAIRAKCPHFAGWLEQLEQLPDLAER